MGSLRRWKILIWAGVFVAVLAVQYIILKKLLWNPAKEEEMIPAPPIPERVTFWYTEDEGTHLIFQPYWAIPFSHQQTDEQLNSILNAHFTYYKLRITSFQSPVIPFVDVRDSVTVILKGGTKITNVPISPMAKNAPLENSLWLKTVCRSDIPGNDKHSSIISLLSLGVAPALKSPVPKAVSMEKYLIAFPRSFSLDQLEAVRLIWNGKEYLLCSKSCKMRDFDEYLRNPNSLFWKETGA